MLLLSSILQTLAPTGVSDVKKNDLELTDVTYAGGFPEDYSDVFGAPAAALPAF